MRYFHEFLHFTSLMGPSHGQPGDTDEPQKKRKRILGCSCPECALSQRVQDCIFRGKRIDHCILSGIHCMLGGNYRAQCSDKLEREVGGVRVLLQHAHRRHCLALVTYRTEICTRHCARYCFSAHARHAIVLNNHTTIMCSRQSAQPALSTQLPKCNTQNLT